MAFSPFKWTFAIRRGIAFLGGWVFLVIVIFPGGFGFLVIVKSKP